MKGVLFLCVANSARSQMAEGLARALLPTEVKVSVRRLATHRGPFRSARDAIRARIEQLHEVLASGQHAKGSGT